MIDSLMLFAAGLGNRMRHSHKNNPKALVQVLGRPIIHYALDLVKLYPFKRVVISTHYMHEEIKESIDKFQQEEGLDVEIHILYEEEFLETGGAVKNALSVLGDKPIFALNTDVILLPQQNLFQQMTEFWKQNEADFLLLMQPYQNTVGYLGYGDFDLDDQGHLVRPDKDGYYDYVFTGLQILDPKKIAKHPLKIFSLKEYYLNSERVLGMKAQDLKWYYVKSPENIVDIEMDML